MESLPLTLDHNKYIGVFLFVFLTQPLIFLSSEVQSSYNFHLCDLAIENLIKILLSVA